MKKLNSFLCTILFRYKNIKVTVRDVIIAIITVLLLFFMLRGCTSNKETSDKEVLTEEVCIFTSHNLVTLEELFARPDVCSEAWYTDVDDYIVRLQEQNALLETKTSKQQQEIYTLQVKIVERLQAFRENPTVDNLDLLEERVERYQDWYNKDCKEGEE